MHRRFYIPLAVAAALLGGAYLAFHAWDVEFMGYIVKRTVIEKSDPSVDRGMVRERFAVLESELARGLRSRSAYRQALLDCAAEIEKVEVLRPADVERLFGFFTERK